MITIRRLEVCSVAFTRHKFAGERGHLLDAHVGPNEIVADIAPLFPPAACM